MCCSRFRGAWNDAVRRVCDSTDSGRRDRTAQAPLPTAGRGPGRSAHLAERIDGRGPRAGRRPVQHRPNHRQRGARGSRLAVPRLRQPTASARTTSTWQPLPGWALWSPTLPGVLTDATADLTWAPADVRRQASRRGRPTGPLGQVVRLGPDGTAGPGRWRGYARHRRGGPDRHRP